VLVFKFPGTFNRISFLSILEAMMHCIEESLYLGYCSKFIKQKADEEVSVISPVSHSTSALYNL
jgi:hypothetical protein